MISDIWAYICVVAFYGWILSTIGFVLKSFPVKGVFHVRSAAVWGCTVVVFFTIWLVGMFNA